MRRRARPLMSSRCYKLRRTESYEPGRCFARDVKNCGMEVSVFENQNHSHVFVKGFSVVTPNQEILGQWTLRDVNILKDMTEKKKKMKRL